MTTDVWRPFYNRYNNVKQYLFHIQNILVLVVYIETQRNSLVAKPFQVHYTRVSLRCLESCLEYVFYNHKIPCPPHHIMRYSFISLHPKSNHPYLHSTISYNGHPTYIRNGICQKRLCGLFHDEIDILPI